MAEIAIIGKDGWTRQTALSSDGPKLVSPPRSGWVAY
jgi:hypothetical protein